MDNNNTNDNLPESEAAKSSNYAISIVVVVGILLGIILIARSPASDSQPPTPGPGTPQVSLPIATPPTAQVQPTQPVQDRPTNIPATAVQPTIPVVQPSPIQGINWQWVSVTDKSTSQTTSIPNPAQYTIVFTAEGFVNGNADCNSFTGTYSLDNGLNIRINSMTRAACPEGSLDQEYIQLLESVAAGGPDGTGSLALETAGGAQRMLFQNGGPGQ
jgi:heat shock protein HslJ